MQPATYILRAWFILSSEMKNVRYKNRKSKIFLAESVLQVELNYLIQDDSEMILIIYIYNHLDHFKSVKWSTTDTRVREGLLFSSSFLLACHPSYFHSSLFPWNSVSSSRARDPSAFFFHSLPCRGFPSPSKQPPPTDKTRVVNSTRRKPTHLSLSTIHPPREPRDLLEILTATARSFSATLDNTESHWFLIFLSKFKFSQSFFICNF